MAAMNMPATGGTSTGRATPTQTPAEHCMSPLSMLDTTPVMQPMTVMPATGTPATDSEPASY